jgi:hypothetical protein
MTVGCTKYPFDSSPEDSDETKKMQDHNGITVVIHVPLPPIKISPPASFPFWIYPVILSNAGLPLGKKSTWNG